MSQKERLNEDLSQINKEVQNGIKEHIDEKYASLQKELEANIGKK